MIYRYKTIFIILATLASLYAGYLLLSEVINPQMADIAAQVTIEPGDRAQDVVKKLHDDGFVQNQWLFLAYLKWKGLDTEIKVGEHVLNPPLTIPNMARQLTISQGSERTITILPGWDIRDIAAYLVEEEIAKTKDEVYQLAGQPALLYSGIDDTLGIKKEFDVLKDKSPGMSYEGYFRPDTYRIFSDATVKEVLVRLVKERDTQITDEIYAKVRASGYSFHEILTVASILEREVRSFEDKKIVADLIWRRLDENWALQMDSTVHYAAGSEGSVYTTAAERDSENPWNTYKFPGLPPGPISNPTLESIEAALNPTPNEYNFFLTSTKTGEVFYGRTLEEHNVNKAKYLR